MAFAKRIGVDRGSLRWFLNLYAKCISEDQTPNILKMENDVKIYCVLKQVNRTIRTTHHERLLYLQQVFLNQERHDLKEKKGLMKTKTTAAKRVTWDPDITDKNLASGLTQTSSPSPDLETVLEMDPKVGPGQTTTKVLDRRPKNRNKVAIRWAQKMNNRRLAKIAKKRADDCRASLNDQCLRATPTVPVPTVAKSLPPS